MFIALSLNGGPYTETSIPINQKVKVIVDCGTSWIEYELKLSNRCTFQGGEWKEASDAEQTISLEPKKYQLEYNGAIEKFEAEFIVTTPGEFKITVVSLRLSKIYVDLFSSNDLERSYKEGYLSGEINYSNKELWASTGNPCFEKTYFYLKGFTTGDVEIQYETSVFGSLYIDGIYRFTSTGGTQLVTTVAMTENEFIFFQQINSDGGDRFSKSLKFKDGSMNDFANIPQNSIYAIDYSSKIEMDLEAVCPNGLSEIETDGVKSWSVIWGDGQVHASEEWDEGSSNGSGGWSSSWEVQDGWAWTTDSPSVCTQW